MTSRAKKRTLTVSLFAAWSFFTALGFWPVGTLGLPAPLWAVLEAGLCGGVTFVVGVTVADWAERDD